MKKNNKTIYLLLLFIGLSGLFGCITSTRNAVANKGFIDLSARDTTVSPADDFFEYANGTWLKNTEIPADQVIWGTFPILSNKVNLQVKSILDSCAALKNLSFGSPAQEIRDLYASVMDSSAIDKSGLSPLRAGLDRIAAIKNIPDIINEMAQENVDGDWWWNWYSGVWGWSDVVTGSGQLCTLYVFADDKNSDSTRLQCAQGGLGLPNKTYYFKTDSASLHIVGVYKNYIAKILNLTGDSGNAKANAEAIFSLEKKLASASRAKTDLDDPQSNYHLMSIKEAQKLAPNIHWQQLLNKMGVQTDTVLIRQPAFYQALSALLKSEPVSLWKNYFTFHLVNHYAPWLSQPFEEANFTFEQALTGQKGKQARWKRASQLINNSIGDALGRLYVKQYFPASSKEYMEKLVVNLKTAFRQHIKDLDWMSDATKTKALDKLNAMVTKIGYPDKWKDYSSARITPNSLIENLKQIGRWYYQYDMAKLHHEVVRADWYMTPATVNAYNNPTSNDINFPAAILQPPFYFSSGDDAVNYGAIGSVIGHEMTHSFDNMGSQYGKTGSLKNWWTKEDHEKFEKLAEGIIRQYDNYVVLDSNHLNGKLEELENIADNGGVAIAYTAFQKTSEANKDTIIDGLTPDQRFFMAYAQEWRSKLRPQTLLWLINGNGHAPGKFRTNGPLSNMPAFYKAFNVKPGDGMYRPDSLRVKIW